MSYPGGQLPLNCRTQYSGSVLNAPYMCISCKVKQALKLLFTKRRSYSIATSDFFKLFIIMENAKISLIVSFLLCEGEVASWL